MAQGCACTLARTPLLRPPTATALHANRRGPSGSGKTSLLNTLAGQVPANSRVKLTGALPHTGCSAPHRAAAPSAGARRTRRYVHGSRARRVGRAAASPAQGISHCRGRPLPPLPPPGRVTINGVDATAANHRQAYVEQTDQFYSMLTGEQ